jgi:hypothetical protein
MDPLPFPRHPPPVTKRGLPTVDDTYAALGHETIMNGGLASKHGSKYVRLAAFAIDLDRVRDLADDAEDSLFPFGFEVFLIELALSSVLDTEDENDLALLEDACVAIFEALRDDEEPPLGASLLFAVYDALRSETLPARFEALFEGWKEPPEELLESLDALFDDAELEAMDLAEACLLMSLSPPLAPPTRAMLEAMQDVTEVGTGEDR